jgi:hypothetical protein
MDTKDGKRIFIVTVAGVSRYSGTANELYLIRAADTVEAEALARDHFTLHTHEQYHETVYVFTPKELNGDSMVVVESDVLKRLDELPSIYSL